MFDIPMLARLALVRAASLKRGVVAPVTTWRSRIADVRNEGVMACNRLAAGGLMFAALAVSAGDATGDLAFPHWRADILIWLTLAVGLLVHMVTYPQAAATRRCVAMLVDVGGASFILHMCGGPGAFVWPVYLWIIFGNGLRFGGRYLLLSSMLSLAGFGVVIALTPFWRSEVSLTGGLVAALVVIPGYAYLLVRQLANAQVEAERANRTKSLFMAGVSHELRTPLHAITGLTEVLQTTRLDPDQSSMISTIDMSAAALQSMIEDVLSVSRIEAGAPNRSSVEFDLTRVVADVQNIIGVQTSAKGLHLNTFITARTPLALRGDAARMREVLLSLCANAVKFTAEGRITVAVDGDAGPDDRVQLRVEVTDTGIGIEPAAQSRIFEMFTQANPDIAARFGGTGMGLAICSRHADILGGTLGVTSDPGHGSTFWLTVPMETGPQPEEPLNVRHPIYVVAKEPESGASLIARLRTSGIDAQVAPRPAGGGIVPVPSLVFVDPGDGPAVVPALPEDCVKVLIRSHSDDGLPMPEVQGHYATAIDVSSSDSDALLRRAVTIASARFPAALKQLAVPPAARRGSPTMRVLVADDNPVNRRVVTRILEHAGHEIITAPDGEQALSVLCEASVDVALLDVNMPVLSGIDVARSYLHSAPTGARIPLIALTADGTSETRVQCLAAGMTACLVKPLRSTSLLDALDGALVSGRPTSVAGRLAEQGSPCTSALPALDLVALADLASVGGEGFVSEVLRDFVKDTDQLVTDLEAALLTRDLIVFHARAHALCSSAANIGASGLHQLCLPWHTITASEMERTGEDLLRLLQDEWARSRAALLERATCQPTNTPRIDVRDTYPDQRQ